MSANSCQTETMSTFRFLTETLLSVESTCKKCKTGGLELLSLGPHGKVVNWSEPKC